MTMDTVQLKPKRVNVLEPPGRWSALKLGELWHYRELLYILAWRDVKVRYKQAVLGAAWAVLQPLVMMGDLHACCSAGSPTCLPGASRTRSSRSRGSFPWTLFSSAVGSLGATASSGTRTSCRRSTSRGSSSRPARCSPGSRTS